MWIIQYWYRRCNNLVWGHRRHRNILGCPANTREDSTTGFFHRKIFNKASVSQGFWSTNLQSFKSWKRRPLIAVASDAIDLFPFPCLSLVGSKAGFRRDGWKRCDKKMSHKCPCIAYEKIMKLLGISMIFSGRYWRRFEGKSLDLGQVIV